MDQFIQFILVALPVVVMLGWIGLIAAVVWCVRSIKEIKRQLGK